MKVSKLFDYTVPMVSAATVLSLGIIIVAMIGAYTARDIKLARDTIEVTGSAKESVVADNARWIINLETKTGPYNQQSGFDRLEGATKKITAYLTEQGLTEFETPAMTSWTDYTYPQNGAPILNGYIVNRQILVRSDDVEKLSTLANNIQPLTGADYNVTTQSLELTYSKLNEMRVKLLSEAVKDAQDRAEAIAKESGRNVGVLRNASGGVVQVLPQGGIEVSDYGSYDTQSKNKDIMVTVRATFEL